MTINANALKDVDVVDQHDDDVPATGRRPMKLVLSASYVEAPEDYQPSELAKMFDRAALYGYAPVDPELLEAEELGDGHVRIPLVPATLSDVEPHVILRHDPSQSEAIRIEWDEAVGAHVVTFGSYPHGEGTLAGMLYGLAQGALPEEAE